MLRQSIVRLYRERTAFICLLAFSVGLAASLLSIMPQVSAAALTSKSDTLSTSEFGADANHTIVFTTPTGAAEGTTIIVEFDTLGTADQFNFTGLIEDDIDIEDDGVDKTTAADCIGTEHVGVAINTTNDDITFTICAGDGGAIAGASVVTIKVGSNATGSGTGTIRVNNPSKTAAAGTADINDIKISGTFGDTGSMLVATIEGVTVSVTVSESLTFTMAGVASGSCTGDTGTPTVVDTSGSATTVPFGTVSSSNAFFTACQLLSISTNASAGYVMTASENQSLLAGSTTLDDTLCDATCSETTGTAWATATNNGLGFWCQEVTNTSCTDAGDATTEHRQFACTGADAVCDPGTGVETAQNVMQTAVPADNDQGRVHYKLSVGATQPAGIYSNTVTYIATPTFQVFYKT